MLISFRNVRYIQCIAFHAYIRKNSATRKWHNTMLLGQTHTSVQRVLPLHCARTLIFTSCTSIIWDRLHGTRRCLYNAPYTRDIALIKCMTLVVVIVQWNSTMEPQRCTVKGPIFARIVHLSLNATMNNFTKPIRTTSISLPGPPKNK